MAGKRRQFTPEFKLEAVRLANDSEKPLSQVAGELGIRPDMLRMWKRQAEGRVPTIGSHRQCCDDRLNLPSTPPEITRRSCASMGSRAA
jgi:transposase-like protein